MNKKRRIFPSFLKEGLGDVPKIPVLGIEGHSLKLLIIIKIEGDKQMKNFSTWILVMFMAMFWVLRIIVAFTYELGSDFGGMQPFNQTMEIILLFVVLVCMILVVKRKMVGALIYLLAYGMYFGPNLITGITTIATANADVSLSEVGLYMNTFVSLIGMVIPIAILFDLLLDKNRKANPKDKKTDWFYKNEQFDRKLDDRADKNNYRTM